MKIFWPILLMSALLVGCGTLIPKKVEFFQDKVEAFPEAKSREKEVQKETAARAAQASLDTLISAVDERASTNVVNPAKDAVVLSGAVARSLGPPETPSTDKADELSAKLD